MLLVKKICSASFFKRWNAVQSAMVVLERASVSATNPVPFRHAIIVVAVPKLILAYVHMYIR